MARRVYRAEGAMGRWTLVESMPECLAGTVERLWYFSGQTALPRERVMPNGVLELIVHLGPCFGIVHNDRTERCAPVGISGIQTRPMIIEAPDEPCRVLGIQFTPAGAYSVLGRPLHELTGLDVDLETLLGAAAIELADTCHEARSAEACLDVAARWILERLRTARCVDPPVAWVAARIRDRHGDVSIEALRERTGLTKSRLATTFREQIGVTPKLYARIHRFRRAITRLHAPSVSLSTLALESGYYDQPHFSAEFRELSGLTPGEFLVALKYETGNNIAER